MLKKAILCSAVVLALASMALGDEPEYRAFWVDAWHPGIKTRAQVDQLISTVRSLKMNAVFAQVRRRGDTYYPSPFEPWATDADQTFDALAYLIQKAHTGTPRIDVHAWITTYPIASDPPPSNPDHPYNRYPDWLMKDVSGNTVFDGGYWFDPGHPGVEQFTYDIMMDLVTRYDVDGIHFDLVRYPGDQWGYNAVSVQRFNAAYGRTGQPSYTDAAWCDWRRAQVTGLVRKVYADAIRIKPAVKVSAATVTWTPAASEDDNWPTARPYRQVFQDWRSWMQEGILDLNVPMDYYDCGEEDFYTWLCFIIEHQYDRQTLVGVSSCDKSDACLNEQILATRMPCAGGTRGKGWCIFSYNCTTSGHQSIIASLCPGLAPIPDMPWKSAPTKGHIRGAVTYAAVTPLDNATVSLTGPTSRTAKTDGTGFYAFIDLPPGSYTVTASKSGYGTKAVGCSVTAGQVATADIDFAGTLAISNVQVSNETGSSVTVTWTTNAGSTSQVAYGLDRDCSNYTTEDPTYVTSHSVVVAGLQPLTPYYYRVISRNPTTPVAMSDIYVFVTGAIAPDIVIDNPAATFVGSWSIGSSSTDKYGSDYHWVSTGTADVRYAYWTPNITVPGNYKVYVWYPQGSNRSLQAPYTIFYNGGNQTYLVNQQTNGGRWNELGTKSFAAGTGGYVRLGNNAPAGKIVVADAVRFQCQLESVAPSTPTNLQAQVVSPNQINLTWAASTDNVAVAGYRIYRDGYVVATSTTNSFSDIYLAPNTRYTFAVSAYDTSGNKSAISSSALACTLSQPPSSQTITCSKPAGTWQTSNPFIFTVVGGFGTGRVSYYSYSWDTSPTHVWTGTEFTWLVSTKSLYAVSGPNPYYLHVRGYNDDGIPNGTADLGPYYLDETEPAAPVVVDDGESTPDGSQVHALWACSDPDSGICGYEYGVGTTPGGTELVGWTPTSETSATVPIIPIQPPGTMLYFAVKARNCAGTWGAVGTSDGISVGSSAIANVKLLPDGSEVVLTNKLVTAVFADCFYIADDTRVSGIRVNLATSYEVGERVSVTGVLATIDGERRIVGAGAQLVP